jgi:proline utilization trans-activator
MSSADPLGNLETNYMGYFSSDVAARRISDLAGIVRPDGGNRDSSSTKSLYNRSALRLQRLSRTDPVRLPPYPVAKHLFEAQHSYIGTIFSFVEPETFELQLQAAYSGLPEDYNQEACLTYSKVLVVLAFGQLYSVNQWDGFDGPPGFEYFTHALQYLPDVHEESSVLFVETLALIGYFFQNLDRRDTGYVYVGIALRMAISLGLHREDPNSGLDESTKEHRKRVWWSIYSLDRILSVNMGNPIIIQDEDISVTLPLRLPHEPEFCRAVVLRHYTELSTILGRIGDSLYRKAARPGSSLMAAIREIISSLDEWHPKVPDELRFDPAKLLVTRESVSTFAHYYQCINMTARQLLFHIVQQRQNDNRTEDWKHGLDPFTVSVIQACISAAQDTVVMMTIAAEKDLLCE